MDRIPHDDGTRPCAVYWLFNAEGRLLYVGMCFNVARRMSQHKQRAAWWGEVAGEPQVTWMANRATADIAETIAINLENPKYNSRKKMNLAHGLDCKVWVPSLGTELRCTDTVTPVAVRQAAAPHPLAEKIGIREGAPVLVGTNSIIREERVIARLALWRSPLPGSVPALDTVNGFSPWTEHRDASDEEALAIGVESGSAIDAAWRSPGDRTVPGRWRESIVELIVPCDCPDGAAEPLLNLYSTSIGKQGGSHPNAKPLYRYTKRFAWHCPDCDAVLPGDWLPALVREKPMRAA